MIQDYFPIIFLGGALVIAAIVTRVSKSGNSNPNYRITFGPEKSWRGNS
jgi:hypothetical protein